MTNPANPCDKLFQRLKRIFKLRFAVLYPAGAWALWALRCDANSLRLGSCVVAAGLLVRSWANGYAIKMDKLTTSGPYAFLRHPLYAGTLLMVAGFAVILRAGWLGAAFVVFFAVVYWGTMRSEERMLTDKFGDAYRNYRAEVPPLWPALRAYAAGEKWPFARERYWRSQEYKLILWTAVSVLVIFLRTEWDLASGVWNGRMTAAAAGIVLLAAADGVITAVLKTAVLKSRSHSAHA